MDLLTSKQCISSIQKFLGLNPETVPEVEFFAELFAIRQTFKSECVRVDYAGEGLFRCGDGLEIPCVDIILQEDDAINGPGRTLCFTYYNGDNVPAGLHHALVITDPTNQKLIYWRKRGQKPETEWAYNIYARTQVEFKFNCHGTNLYSLNRESLYEHLRKSLIDDSIPITAAECLNIDSSYRLLAEVAHLNAWNANNGGILCPDDFTFTANLDANENQLDILITCDKLQDIEPLTLIYTVNDSTSRHGLTILEGDNVIYERDPNQNEATEWFINSLANDPIVTDENGAPLFIGEPVTE